MRKLLLISFDAVGDAEVDILLRYPNFGQLAAQSTLVREAASIFLTNTYPIHASIVTGQPQSAHGVISNTEPFPRQHPRWNFDETNLRTPPIWKLAAERGLRVAAVMWPVTAHSRYIRYNIPEILPPPGGSQALASLRAGSPLFQIAAHLRHRTRLRGIGQPARDGYAAACMSDAILYKNPALMLMHFTAYDSARHWKGAAGAEPALAALDQNLGLLLECIDDQTDVIVFSDHAQLDVHTSVQPNDLLTARGLLGRDAQGYQPGATGCFYECCGGSAFFHSGTLPQNEIAACQAEIVTSEGFHRLLRSDEMAACGRAALPFGFCAKPGYHYEAERTAEKANHGYPADYANYSVFYVVRRAGLQPGQVLRGGCIQEITAIAADILGLAMPDIGPVRAAFRVDA